MRTSLRALSAAAAAGCPFPSVGDLTGGSIDATADTTVTDAATDDASAPTYVSVVESDDPASYWRFGEKSAQLAAHDEMSVIDGKYSSTGATVGVPGAIATDPNTAVSFDGTTGNVLIGDVYPFAGGSRATARSPVVRRRMTALRK